MIEVQKTLINQDRYLSCNSCRVKNSDEELFKIKIGDENSKTVVMLCKGCLLNMIQKITDAEKENPLKGDMNQ